MTRQILIPKRPGSGDAYSFVVILLIGALTLQFLDRVFQYAPLRNEGSVVTGRWVDQFTDRQTGETRGIYIYVVDAVRHQGQQARHGGSDEDEAVAIIYLPSDPGFSRILGTEQIVWTDVVFLVICLIILILACQYILAYYRRSCAWVLWFWQRFETLRTL